MAIIAAVLCIVTGLQSADYVPGVLIVRFEPGQIEVAGVDETPISQVTIHSQELANALQDCNAYSVERLNKCSNVSNPLSQIYRIRIDESADEEQVASQLEELAEVIYASASYLGHYFSRYPNDPDFVAGKQWGLDLDGSNIKGGIKAPEAWDIETGRSEINLAILDTGLDPAHRNNQKEFFDRVVAERPYNDVADEIGHGTHMTGIAAAKTNDGNSGFSGYGMAGVAGGWGNYPTGDEAGVSLMICKLEEDIQNPNKPNLADAVDAIYWAVNNSSEKADVVNCSWGWFENEISGSGILALIDALYYALETRNVTFFFATGNSGTGNQNIAYPAKLAEYDLCCAVGASTKFPMRAGYSCWGPEISFIAPGGLGQYPEGITGWIWSTTIEDGEYGEWYEYNKGTSQACAHASGVGALLYSQAYENYLDNGRDQDKLLWDVDCKRIMEYSATDIVGDDPDFPDSVVSGPDNCTGWGLINAYNAVRHLEEPYTLEHGMIPSSQLTLEYVPGPWLVVFKRSPRPGYPAGIYHCYKYRLSGTISFNHYPENAEDNPWIWGLFHGGTPGFGDSYREEVIICSPPIDTNDAMPWVGVSSLTTGSPTYQVTLETYVFRLEQLVQPPPPPVWFPRAPEEVNIAYTLVRRPTPPPPPQSPGVLENYLETELAIDGSNITSGAVGVSFTVAHSCDVDLAVFDASGCRIETLKQGHAPAGTSNITWPVTQIPAGVYFVRLQTGNQSCTQRVLIVR